MESILERRHRLMTAGPRLYYDVPFHPVRGAGTAVWDIDGKRYLDCYNNVPHVGHCHPRVVQATGRQEALLNTNTRYLYDSVLDYAERLTATMPAGLDVCLFTCTGSEANDLAWRMARAFTGGDAAATSPHGYHGNTTFLDMIDGSAAREGRVAPDWWVTVAVPGPADGDEPGAARTRATAFARNIDAAVDTLRARGHRPAAYFFDTYFCSDGVFPPDDGVMGDGLARFRAAGGICIADEVQPGLGRTGEGWWGFERMGIVPDVVTLGKPLGNGYPIGAVVTRREIAEAFFATGRYFNTFAGNPVASAAGLAVLDVIESEGLQDNARRIGARIRDGLGELARRHEIIGEVRGAGLLLGVELVADRATRAPAGKETRHVINEMCRRGVLVGLTGPNRLARNILKIRPPLVAGDADVDRLLATLDGVLADL
jgi:4-aminobutyrate aminotransferase-like enzyme